MNDVQIVLLENQQTDNHAVLLPTDITKDHKYRLKLYADYLTANGQHWLEPDLNTYSAEYATIEHSRKPRETKPAPRLDLQPMLTMGWATASRRQSARLVHS